MAEPNTAQQPEKPAMFISDETPREKRAFLEKALDTPEKPQSQVIIGKAVSRGWLVTDGTLAQPKPEPKTTSMAEGFGRGVAQGATFGYGEELGSFAERLIAKGSKATGIGPQEVAQRVLDKPRSELVAENRQELEQTREEAPGSYFTGTVVGSTIPALPVMVATAGAPAGGFAAKLAGQAAARPGLYGAASGALYSAGDSDENRLFAALVGGVTGGALGKLLGTPAGLQRVATEYGRRATGFIKSTIKSAGGLDKVNKAVNFLLDKRIIKGGLGEIAAGVDKMRQQSGRIIGKVLDKLDDARIEAFSSEELISKILSSRLTKTGRTIGELMDDPLMKEFRPAMQSVVESVQHNLGSGRSFQALQNIKEGLRLKGWKLGKELPGAELYRDAYKAVTNSLDEIVEKAAPKIGKRSLSKAFIEAKKAYGAAKTAEIGVEDAIQRMAGNRQLGLTDLIFLSQQLSTGNYGRALGVLIGKKVLESKSTQSAVARFAHAAAQKYPGLAGAVGRTVGPAASVSGRTISRGTMESGQGGVK